MQQAKNLKEYRKECQESLDNDYLRTALDTFAVAYRTSRANAFADFDVDELIGEIAEMKDDTLERFDELYAQFKEKAEAAGVTVHWAKDSDEANSIITRIAKETDCKKIIKSKSMTAEETLLNHELEDEGFEVTETDLGEWIIQLRHEGPSHMVMPAIHLSRYQVKDLFSDVTGAQQEEDIEKLVKVARRELRQKFVEADMGVTGANFAVAQTGLSLFFTASNRPNIPRFSEPIITSTSSAIITSVNSRALAGSLKSPTHTGISSTFRLLSAMACSMA